MKPVIIIAIAFVLLFVPIVAYAELEADWNYITIKSKTPSGELRIEDSEGNIVFSQSISNIHNHKQIHTPILAKGDYTVYFKYGNLGDLQDSVPIHIELTASGNDIVIPFTWKDYEGIIHTWDIYDPKYVNSKGFFDYETGVTKTVIEVVDKKFLAFIIQEHKIRSVWIVEPWVYSIQEWYDAGLISEDTHHNMLRYVIVSGMAEHRNL